MSRKARAASTSSLYALPVKQPSTGVGARLATAGRSLDSCLALQRAVLLYGRANEQMTSKQLKQVTSTGKQGFPPARRIDL